jgi:hypothetical protein
MTRLPLDVAALAIALTFAAAPATAGDTPRAVAAIADDLVADDAGVRAKAAAELAGRVPDGAVAAPMLIDLLDDEDPAVVAAAARALDSMSVAGVTVLVEACGKRELLAAKATYDKEFSTVVAAYFIEPRDAFAEGVPATASACLQAALLAPGVGSWTDDQVPRWETALLHAHRTGTNDAGPLAVAGLAMLGADALAAHGIAPAEDPRRVAAARALVPLVASDDVLVSWCGARLAMRLRTSSPKLVAALTGTLIAVKPIPELWRTVTHDRRDPPWLPVRFDRLAAVDALAALGPSAASAAPRLAVVPADPSITSDWCDADPGGLFRPCVRALVRCGGEQELGAVMNREPKNRPFLTRVAAESGCTPALVLDWLVAVVESAAPPTDVFDALGALGPAAARALPALKTRLDVTKDERTKERIAAAIVAIAPDDADAIGFLLSLVKDEDLHMSDNASGWVYDAWGVLCRAAPTPEGVALFVADVDGKHRGTGGPETVIALGRAGSLAKDAVPALLRMVGEPASPGRHALVATVALGRIGPDAAAAVPALTAMRDAGDETVRVPAAQALRRIRAAK